MTKSKVEKFIGEEFGEENYNERIVYSLYL